MATGEQSRRLGDASPVSFELRQALNQPPALFAIDPDSGRAVEIVDPNPGFAQRYALGQARRIDGKTHTGETWQGLLFYPPGYQAGRRYPLVIQSTYAGSFNDEFTLYGSQGGYGLGPTIRAPYPGRLLNSLGIMVLHLDASAQMASAEEAKQRMQAFEAAAEQLVAEGLVDRKRVGLAGFSRNGYYVEYTIAHSNYPFAAAVAADNWDAGYSAQTLLGYTEDAVLVYGADAFGEGLQTWFKESPAFGAERVDAPLLKVEQSRGILGVLLKWEMFERLRHLNKPVEFYVLPLAARGAHNTQNPAQILAVQERSMDWFAFWLTGREDSSPRKGAQYQAWRELRKLQTMGHLPAREQAFQHGLRTH